MPVRPTPEPQEHALIPEYIGEVEVIPTTIAEVPDAELDDLIQQLQFLHLQAGVGHALAIGRLLIDRLYGGDASAYHERNPHKQVKLRALLERRSQELADLRLGQQSIRNAILAVEVFDGLPDDVQERLSHRKLVELARVKDPDRRVQIGSAFAREGWSEAQFQGAVQEHRPPAAARQPDVVRDIGHAARQLRGYDRKALQDLSPKHRAKLQADLAELLAVLAKLDAQ
jgi:hypothetical protein